MNSYLTTTAQGVAAIFRVPLRFFAFWLLFFAAFRLWFTLWFHALWPEKARLSVFASFWHALPLDLSMAGYLVVIPVLLWAIGLVMRPVARGRMEKAISSVNVLFILIAVAIYGANVFLYEEWHTVLNQRAVAYLRTPAALLDSMSLLFQLVSVALYAGGVLLFAWLYRRLVGRVLYAVRIPRWQMVWLPLQFGLIVLAIRGGFGVMPVNESAVYYSASLFNNHAATNVGWHLMHSVLEARATDNHYASLAPDEARRRVEQLGLPDQIAAQSVVRPWTDQPHNVVILVLESMTAQVVGALGGEPGLCPQLDTLIAGGVLFDRCYSSGFRTDQGIVSVLGGYPAQPDQSVVLLEDKAAKLPSMARVLGSHGYSTQFCYGGELTFANIGVWLRNQGFEKVLSERDFAHRQQRWGADDHTVLQRTIRECSALKPPFFAITLTLSLHAPYDVPDSTDISGLSDPDKFRHAARFADRALGAFFAAARREPWFQNTLFVLVADHGHSLPGAFPQSDPRARQVPLVMTGEVIAPLWRGRRIHAVGNHHDLPQTVLAALGYNEVDFPWSRNLLAPKRPEFAYYTHEDGLGWVRPDGTSYLQFSNGEWQDFGTGIPDEDRQQAAAYLQVLYDDFLGL